MIERSQYPRQSYIETRFYTYNSLNINFKIDIDMTTKDYLRATFFALVAALCFFGVGIVYMLDNPIVIKLIGMIFLSIMATPAMIWFAKAMQPKFYK